MKKKIIVVHAAALLLLAACASDDEPVITPPEAQHPLIAARLQAYSGTQDESNTDKPGTRASVKPDYDELTKGELFRWDESDQLALTIATKDATTTWQKFSIDNNSLKAEKPGNADFTGNVSTAKAGDVLYGLSPHKADYGTDLTTVPLSVAAEQTQTNDAANGTTSTAHLGSNMPMYAKATLTKDITTTDPGSTALLPHLSFKHLCPLVRFRIRNASSTPWQVTKIEMRHSTATDNPKWFATKATCNLTAADVPASIVSNASNRSRSMTLNVKNCKVLTKSTTTFAPGNHLNAYIALLPTTPYTADEAKNTPDYLSIFITATIKDSNPVVNEVMEYKVYYKDLDFLHEGLKAGKRYCFNLSIQADASIGGLESGNGEGGQDIGVKEE